MQYLLLFHSWLSRPTCYLPHYPYYYLPVFPPSPVLHPSLRARHDSLLSYLLFFVCLAWLVVLCLSLHLTVLWALSPRLLPVFQLPLLHITRLQSFACGNLVIINSSGVVMSMGKRGYRSQSSDLNYRFL